MRRVIIDTDVGTDDALALLVLFHAEKLNQIKIEAITCTNGNTTVDNVCKNVLRLLETVGRTDIPIYKGSKKQLINLQQNIKLYHGLDGLGDLNYETEPDLSVIKDTPAAMAINTIVEKNPLQITLICLAPLTNIALAARLYDNFVSYVKDIYIMGGNHAGVGNTTLSAEFNFYFDPESAHIVLESFTCPIHILTWETCLSASISKEWRLNIFENLEHPGFKLIAKCENNFDFLNMGTWNPCDAYLAVAYLYKEKTILKQNTYFATVELNGRETRGQLILDHNNKNKQTNVTIIKQIDVEFFKSILLEMVEP